jgi:hypothetical protein
MTNPNQPFDTAASLNQPTSTQGPAGIFDDLESLKLSQDEVGILGSPELIELVPVRKPRKQEFFRVRPGDENCFTTVIYEDQQTRDNYFITPSMLPFARSITDVSVVTLVQFMTRQNVFGVFPLKLATDATAKNSWQTTAMAAAQHAKTKWIRIQADMMLSGYRIYAAESQLGEPKWPELSLSEVLNIAFKDKVIDSQDHSMVNQMLGRL